MAVTATIGNNINSIIVNSINSLVTYSGTLSKGADWIQDSIGNNGVVYSHLPYGKVLFWGHFECGAFGGGKFRVKKWIDGGWNSEIYSKDFGWNTNTDVQVQSTGPGAYRIYSETAFAFNALPWSIYCGQTNCSTGLPIVCWDDFKSSLNKVNTGQLITADLANKQRLGDEY